MDISTLMEIGGGNLKLEVTAADLTKFAKDVVDMTLAARSKEFGRNVASLPRRKWAVTTAMPCRI